ncbi:MAG: ComEC family competence protein, partial [Ectothiorhodospiraceae bacterium]|nr:ComEC family competence protein [Ectothiorhodospiraceae bacterium]
MFHFLAGFSAGAAATAAAPFTLPLALLLAAFLGLAWNRRFLLAGLALGCAWTGWHAEREMARWLPVEEQGREVRVVARVADLPTHLEQGARLTLVLEQAPEDLAPQRVQLNWHGRGEMPAAGERWELTLRLRRPSGSWNPGGFDGERWALTQRIHARASVAGGLEPRRLSPPRGIHAWRSSLSDAMAEAIPQPGARALAVALVVGDRQYLSDRQWHSLLATGTNHLVAISGLHVSLLAGAVWLLVGASWRCLPLLVRYYPAPLAGAWPALAAAIGYAMLAGFSLPTQRAVLMFGVLALALLTRRSLHSGHCLLAAVTLMLIHDPLAPASPTFWLSSLAVAALIVAALRWQHAPVSGWLRAQLALLVILAPVTAYWFGQIAWAAPLANAVAVPLVGALVVPVLLAGAVSLPVWPPLAAFFWQWGGWMLLSLDAFTAWLGSLVELHRTTEALPWWLALAAMAGATLLILASRFPGRLLVLPLLAPLLLASDRGIPRGQAEVVLYDVGHGHAMQIRTRDHQLWLDAGPAGRSPGIPGQGASLSLAYSRDRAGHRGGFDMRSLAATPLCDLPSDGEWDGVRFRVLALAPSASGGCGLLVTAGEDPLLALQGLERLPPGGL